MTLRYQSASQQNNKGTAIPCLYRSNGYMPGKSTDINIRWVFPHLQLPPSTLKRDLTQSDGHIWCRFWKALALAQYLGNGSACFTGPLRPLLGWMANSRPLLANKRGTRQGCPLFPGLFALVMEPLAEALWKSSDVTGICVGSIVEKLALYADELILFLRDPGPSLSKVLQLLGHFAALSGLRTNWSKSLILPIDLRAKNIIDPNSPLQWADSIRYLGINISSNVHDFSKLNLSPKLQWCKQKFKV